MNIAVILAGGSGSRIGESTPKQFLKVQDKSLLEYCIEAFESHELIDRIVIVVREDYISETHSIINQNGYKKTYAVLSGGKERYESSMSALKACTNDNDILLYHDCARPLLSHRIISDCIHSMEHFDAVTVAVRTSDTIYVSSSDGKISSIPPRSRLLNAQTPQCFRVHTIRSAYAKAQLDPDFQPTDDCSVVFRYLPEVPIQIVEGESINIKITYKEDLETMSRIIENRKKVKKS